MRGASDEEQLALASDHGRVLFTQDDDFVRLHALGVDHKGIAYAHQRTPGGHVLRGLTLIYQVLDMTDMKNELEFL